MSLVNQTILVVNRRSGALADLPVLPLLRDAGGIFGVKAVAAGTVIVDPGTPLVKTDTGTYTFLVTGLTNGVDYTYAVEQPQLSGPPLRTLHPFTAGVNPNPPNLNRVGDTLVNHNTGGTDNLRVLDNNANPVDGALIRAYLTSDYQSNATIAVLRNNTTTLVDGRWAQPFYLDHGFNYTIVAEKPGLLNPVAVTVDV